MEEKREKTGNSHSGNNHNGNNHNRPRRPGDRQRRGRPERAEKQYEEVVVSLNRISKTVSGGRHMRFAALVVLGDRKGNVGFGTGKANEVPDAIKKAIEAAKKAIVRVPIVREDTVPHTVMGKFGASKIFLRPAPEGTGIIAGGAVRAVLELAGIRNVYSKIYGSRNAINAVRATMKTLLEMKTATKIAALRGKEISEIVSK